MKYVDILREMTKRKVKQIASSIVLSKEEQIIIRSKLLQSVIDSDGTTLKKYFEFTNDPYELIKSSTIFKHLRLKSGLKFNKIQIATIKFYLIKQGARPKRKSDADYFTNIKLR
jgi:hypothetical protein